MQESLDHIEESLDHIEESLDIKEETDATLLSRIL
jgi:hypothetical protein